MEFSLRPESEATVVVSVGDRTTLGTSRRGVVHHALRDVAKTRRILEKMESGLLLLFFEVTTSIRTTLRGTGAIWRSSTGSHPSSQRRTTMHDVLLGRPWSCCNTCGNVHLLHNPRRPRIHYPCGHSQAVDLLGASLSRYMALTEDAVNEAMTFAEGLEYAPDDLQWQIKRMIIICCPVLLALFVTFTIVSVRVTMDNRYTHGPPLSVFLPFLGMPITLAIFVAMITKLKTKEKTVLQETGNWKLRDETLTTLRRV